MIRLIEFILKFDEHLKVFVSDYGAWTYGVLFAIIFCETGLVVMPMLPGDSLLFAVGAFCAQPDQPLEIWTCLLLLTIAAILGDTVNYHVGQIPRPQGAQREALAMAQSRSTWSGPSSSSKNTAARRSSSPASCRSSARSPRSSRASAE